jgi:hypothetical protein
MHEWWHGHLGPGMQVLTKSFAVDTQVSSVRELMSARPEEA